MSSLATWSMQSTTSGHEGENAGTNWSRSGSGSFGQGSAGHKPRTPAKQLRRCQQIVLGEGRVVRCLRWTVRALTLRINVEDIPNGSGSEESKMPGSLEMTRYRALAADRAFPSGLHHLMPPHRRSDEGRAARHHQRHGHAGRRRSLPFRFPHFGKALGTSEANGIPPRKAQYPCLVRYVTALEVP